MGTYLSKPNTTTVNDEGKSHLLSFGVSSMQGWRITQEDAHTCSLNFDEDISLFAVFDGHGGAEVAEYAAKHLPTFIKKNKYYNNGDLEKALVESFLAFDQSLLEPHVLQILKDMAETPGSDDDDEDEKINEAIALQEEADMPIDQLMAKYGCVVLKKDENQENDMSGDVPTGSSSNSKKELDIVEQPANGDNSELNGSEIKVGEVADEVDKGKIDEIEDTKKEDGLGNGDLEPTQPLESNKIKVDKGKGKKVIIPKPVEEEKKPLYEKFVQDFDAENSDESESDSELDDDDDDDDSEDEEEEDEVDDEDDDHEVSMGLGEVPGKDSGCTACVALVKGRTLFVANAGDSRCVVSRDGVAVDMSLDHKPEDEVERNRIEKAGGHITADGRVNGGLNLSRALGDHTYKDNVELPLKDQMISPEPDVTKLELTDKDEFFIVACDGIWNSMSSQQVVDFVRERIKSKTLVAICEELFHACLAPDSIGDGTGCDNMTAVIVELNNQKLKRPLEDGVCTENEDASTSKKPKNEGCSSSSSSSSSK